MKFLRQKVSVKTLIPLFVLLSVVMLLIHHAIYKEASYWAGFLLLHELALMPLEFVVVTLGFEQIMEWSHKRENRAKVSMIESVFFSESGADMLRYLVCCDDLSGELREVMDVQPTWGWKQVQAARNNVKRYTYEVNPGKVDFFGLHYHLSTRHSYFLKVIENPALSGKEHFTDLLLHIYHLWEELESRTDLYQLTDEDRAYLCTAANAVYRCLSIEWMYNATDILMHQPERLSHVLRTNPFLR